MAERILMNEYKSLTQEDWVNIEVCAFIALPLPYYILSITDNPLQLQDDDIFNWTIGLIVLNPESLYYGGYLKASMNFSKNYPYSPPGKYFPRSFSFSHGFHDCMLKRAWLHRIPIPTPPLPSQHLSRRQVMYFHFTRTWRR